MERVNPSELLEIRNVAELTSAKSLVRSKSSRLELVFRFDRNAIDYLDFVQELECVVAEQGAELREMHAGVFRAVDPASRQLSANDLDSVVTIPVANADDLEKALATVRSRPGSDRLVFLANGAGENRRHFANEIGRCALQHHASLQKLDHDRYLLVDYNIEP